MAQERTHIVTGCTGAGTWSIEAWVNVNGTVVRGEQACISVFDRGFLFGDSVYEVIRTYNGVPFALTEHLHRMRCSARALGMEPALDSFDIEAELARTLANADYTESYARIIVTRGVGPIGLEIHKATLPNLVIIVQPLTTPPTEAYERGIHLAVVSVVRNLVNALDPAIKSGNYLNNLLALREAQENGADEAVMLDYQGYLTEATTSNIFMVFDGILVTPPLDAGILEGITRKRLLGMVADHGIGFQIRRTSGEELATADECFLSSTTKEVLPVTMINGNKVGDGAPGPVTRRLANLFRAHVGQSPRYSRE
ncbi:D-amino acid aminotransferase [bacterium]|nr:D-amino acid aminotransferase [candidate division CSSED10-310 bacterium]